MRSDVRHARHADRGRPDIPCIASARPSSARNGWRQHGTAACLRSIPTLRKSCATLLVGRESALNVRRDRGPRSHHVTLRVSLSGGVQVSETPDKVRRSDRLGNCLGHVASSDCGPRANVSQVLATALPPPTRLEASVLDPQSLRGHLALLNVCAHRRACAPTMTHEGAAARTRLLRQAEPEEVPTDRRSLRRVTRPVSQLPWVAPASPSYLPAAFSGRDGVNQPRFGMRYPRV